MKLQEAGRKRAQGQSDDGRVAEVALIPDEPACPAWLEWLILEPHALRRLIASHQNSKGKVKDDERLGRDLVRRCCGKIHGISVGHLREYGILSLSYEEWLGYVRHGSGREDLDKLSEAEIGELADATLLETDEDTPLWLYDESLLFRGVVVRWQEVARIHEAEDVLRKKRSAVSSDTSD